MGAELREATFLMLTALADGPKHGYGVICEVERISDNRVRLRAGTLYAALDRLSEQRLVEVSGEEVVDGRLRRYYRLTQSGTATLRRESELRIAASKEALRRLRLAGGFA